MEVERSYDGPALRSCVGAEGRFVHVGDLRMWMHWLRANVVDGVSTDGLLVGIVDALVKFEDQ